MKNINHYSEHITLYAIILLLVGLLLRYWVGRRRFNRRGIAGMQYFKSYGIAQITLFFETLLNIIGLVLIIGAVILHLIKLGLRNF